LKATQAKTVKAADGSWKTTLNIDAQKYYADSKGKEAAAALSEPIEIGVFSGRPGIGAFGKTDVIAIEKRPVAAGKIQLVITSAKKPKFAGIDPYNFYIDRNSDDNVIDVTG
jgi:ABC-2 type transport system permease protein